MNMGLIERLERAAAGQLGKRTVECYGHWARQLYAFIGRPASSWSGNDIREFLWMMHRKNYSPVSRKQALCAAAFLFKRVLQVDMGTLDLPPMPRIHQTLRIVPSREELAAIFEHLHGQIRLMCALMYGGGPRVSECCELRVHDVDIPALTLRVHGGKGDKSRQTIIPRILVGALTRHIEWRQRLHDEDRRRGWGLVELPGRLAHKYGNAPRDFGWQFVFPSNAVRNGYRWHITDEAVSKQMRVALRKAGIHKRITPHCLRHGFATHAMQDGNDMRTVADLLGHEDMNTTKIYVHADRARGVSPLDHAGAIPAQRDRMIYIESRRLPSEVSR